jgi:hypothetical protein
MLLRLIALNLLNIVPNFLRSRILEPHFLLRLAALLPLLLPDHRDRQDLALNLEPILLMGIPVCRITAILFAANSFLSRGAEL